MNLKQVISIFFVILSTVRVHASSVALLKEAKEVNYSYALFTAESTANKELDVLRSIAIDGNEAEYEKWKVAIKNDWLKAFLVYEAIEAQKFWFALKVFNEISTDAEEFDTIKLQMKEGSDEKYEWILVVLEKAVQKVPSWTGDMKEKVVDLRRAIVSKIHDLSLINLGVPSNVANSIKDGQWVAPYAALVNSFIHSEVSRQYYYSDGALKQAIEADKPSLVNLLLLNHEIVNAGNLAVALTNLSKLNLYKLVKSPLMIRQLKKFKIPILWDYLQLRDTFPDITPESKRSEILNLMKLTTEEEKKRFKELYGGKDGMTMEEAIKTGSWSKVMGLFMQEEIGHYQKDWFKLAIKYGEKDCFHVLLDERVPFIGESELEAALNTIAADKRQAFRDKWNRFKKYYKDNKCIDGPLGCDKEKYDAWIESNKSNEKQLIDSVEKDKHENIGKLIRDYIRNKGGDPANEYDVANYLGKLDLYKKAKTLEMVKKLIELKVPLVWGHLYVRDYFLHTAPESKRAEILNMLKLSRDGDKKRYKDLYGGNDNMTMEEAMKTGSWEKVLGLFMREDIGHYQKDWFKLAVKYGGKDCFQVLLDERVPFLEEQEFEAALNTIAEDKRQEFRNKWNIFKTKYKDNKCIDGPLGCDKEKYDAWFELNNPTDAILEKTVEHDKHEIIGKMIKNYIKLNGGDPENEVDVANNLGELDLYEKTKSPEMVKKLKESKVPLIWEHLCVRININIDSEIKRSEMLNIMKLTLEGDKQRYKLLSRGISMFTMHTYNKRKCRSHESGVFLREDVGVYKSEWFNLAIAKGSVDYFNILLEERVPLLKEAEFEAALSLINESKRQKFRDMLNEYKRYYKDGVCIDGPIGCDKEKYDAWLRSGGKMVTFSTSGAGGASGSLSAAATLASECNPLA